MATSILIIDRGKKIIEGLKTDLFDPAQTLVSIDTNDNLNAKQILQQTQWQQCIQESELDLKLQLHKNQIPQLIQFLATQPIEVFAIKPIHSLEDYFLKVTNHVHTI